MSGPLLLRNQLRLFKWREAGACAGLAAEAVPAAGILLLRACCSGLANWRTASPCSSAAGDL